MSSVTILAQILTCEVRFQALPRKFAPLACQSKFASADKFERQQKTNGESTMGPPRGPPCRRHSRHKKKAKPWDVNVRIRKYRSTGALRMSINCHKDTPPDVVRKKTAAAMRFIQENWENPPPPGTPTCDVDRHQERMRPQRRHRR